MPFFFFFLMCSNALAWSKLRLWLKGGSMTFTCSVNTRTHACMHAHEHKRTRRFCCCRRMCVHARGSVTKGPYLQLMVIPNENEWWGSEWQYEGEGGVSDWSQPWKDGGCLEKHGAGAQNSIPSAKAIVRTEYYRGGFDAGSSPWHLNASVWTDKRQDF